MQQLTQLWNSFSKAQRISLVVIPLILILGGYGMVNWQHDRGFRTLYSSLSPEDAAAMTQKIREVGIEFRLDETGAAILVPSTKIAEARLALAGAGMPHSGRIGFELFDKTNLGASDFSEQVNYQRALEGELERTVASLSEVEQARIHLTPGKDSVFLDSRQPAKATVVLKVRSNSRLAQTSVTAIANLVASAVEGLAPEAVSIVDGDGRLLNRPRASLDNDSQAAEAGLDYRHQLEAEMQAKIGSALEPLLGSDRFRVGINIDCDLSTTEENNELFDQTKSAVLTSQTSEEGNHMATTGGTPGTATNLPRPAAQTAGSTSGVVHRTENVTYQPSRTVRHTISPKGSIRKVSAVVLVDHTIRWEGSGAKARKTLVPPSPELVKGVHDIVAGIMAFDEERGDQLTVETLPFESTSSAAPPLPSAPAPKATGADWKQPAVLGGVAAAVLLLLAAACLMMRRKPVASAVEAAATLPAGAADAQPAISAGAGTTDRQLNEMEAQARIEQEALSRLGAPANTKTTEVLIRHIRESVTKDPTSAANVLRSWISDGTSTRQN